MYLFYVVDGLDIKKIEKNWKKMNIFVPNDFFPIFPDFFPILTIFPLFSRRRLNPDRAFNNIVVNTLSEFIVEPKRAH